MAETLQTEQKTFFVGDKIPLIAFAKIKGEDFHDEIIENVTAFKEAIFVYYLMHRLNYSEVRAMGYVQNLKTTIVTKSGSFGFPSSIILEIDKPFHVEMQIHIDNPEDNPYWIYKHLIECNFDVKC